MATTDLHFIAGGLHPVKRGIRFIGGNSDDGVQVDAAAAAIVAGNHTIGTISAWVMVPDKAGTYTIFGAGNSAAVEYVHITIKAGAVWVMFVDTGPSTRIDVSTAANTIQPHKWHHVAVVQDGIKLKIYIDGEEMALTWATSTEMSQWFDDLDTINGAHIGCADSIAGGGALTQEFKGYISDVRIWSGTTTANALTEGQINRVMAGGSVGTPHNWWSLDQDLIDWGSGLDNGTAVGDIIYSDANEFASRLTFLETVPLAADKVTITADKGVGFAYSILAA
jgi:tellurite resistance-related uncharacterized protein